MVAALPSRHQVEQLLPKFYLQHKSAEFVETCQCTPFAEAASDTSVVLANPNYERMMQLLQHAPPAQAPITKQASRSTTLKQLQTQLK